MTRVSFRPVELPRDAERCIAFRKDSYMVSFGTDEAFYRDNGPNGERYLDFLSQRIALDPNYVVFALEHDNLIGQIELGPYRADDTIGYVNLYYVVPEARRRGIGKQLDAYATSYLKSKGFAKARLSVSPTNVAAMTFYSRSGWRDLGPRPDAPNVHLMEKDLS